MAVQKSKVTRSRRGQRRSHDSLSAPTLSVETTGVHQCRIAPPKLLWPARRECGRGAPPPRKAAESPGRTLRTGRRGREVLAAGAGLLLVFLFLRFPRAAIARRRRDGELDRDPLRVRPHLGAHLLDRRRDLRQAALVILPGRPRRLRDGRLARKGLDVPRAVQEAAEARVVDVLERDVEPERSRVPGHALDAVKEHHEPLGGVGWQRVGVHARQAADERLVRRRVDVPAVERAPRAPRVLVAQTELAHAQLLERASLAQPLCAPLRWHRDGDRIAQLVRELADVDVPLDESGDLRRAELGICVVVVQAREEGVRLLRVCRADRFAELLEPLAAV